MSDVTYLHEGEEVWIRIESGFLGNKIEYKQAKVIGLGVTGTSVLVRPTDTDETIAVSSRNVFKVKP